jgi:hypothetical protein
MADIDNHDRGVHGAREIDMKDHDTYALEDVEHVDLPAQNHTFDEEVQSGLHARTWVALAALFLLNYTQVMALQGPPAVVSTSDQRTSSVTISR